MTLLGTLRTWLRTSDGRLEVTVRSDLTDASAIPTTAAVTAGIAAGGGIVRNTHTHSTAGALSIARAAADQDTVATITANATSWTHNLTTDRDHLSGRIQGDGVGPSSYTLELDGVFDSIIQAGATALDFASIPIHPDTAIEFSLVRNGTRFDLAYNVLDAGTPPAATFADTATSYQSAQGTYTLDTSTFTVGDLAVIMVGDLAAGQAALPAGFTQFASYEDTNSVDARYGWKVLQAADIGASAISYDGVSAVMFSVSGPTAGPTFASFGFGTTVTTLDPAAITTNNDNALVVSSLITRDAVNHTAPANMTAGSVAPNTSTRSPSFAYTTVATAGSFDPDAWTFGSTQGASELVMWWE